MDSKKIAYSLLELALVPQGRTMKQTLNDTLALAQVAEAAQYKRVWFAEHHNSENIGSSATSLLMGYVAENTSTIRVGSGGIMLPNHSPLIIAEQFGTLAHLYPERIDMGLGRAPGTDPQTAAAIRADFMEAAHSFPGEVKKIQRYFSPENRTAKVRAPIAEGTQVPIYILGSSTDSAHLAAAMGLPYAFASHFATTHLHNALRIYREEFQPSELLDRPYTMAGANIVVADTDAQAERLFTTLIKMFIGVLTGSRSPLPPPTEMTQDLITMLNHPTINQMLRCSFVGGKGTVKAKVGEFLEETGVEEIIAVSSLYAHNDRVRSLQLFAEIMGEINAAVPKAD